MDILVMLEENPDHSPVLAHVNSVPSPLPTSSVPGSSRGRPAKASRQSCHLAIESLSH